MVRVSLLIVARQGQASSLAVALRLLMARTSGCPGLVASRVSTDLANPSEFHYVEEWLTEVDLQAQIRSERFKFFIAVLEAAAQPPQFDVELVSQFRGLDYVEGVLRGKES
jgi:quinol monooxygenase YgiN